jgi:hypothetical protein
MGSAPGRDKNLRMISLEPSEPEPVIFIKKKLSRKGTSGQITGKKFTTSILFYGKNLAHFVFIFERHFFSKYKAFLLNRSFLS